MADGFLGRWSQRKQAVREGKRVPEPPAPSPQPSPNGRGREQPGVTSLAAVAPLSPVPSPQRGEGGGEGSAEAPTLTLDDVTGLTAQSDFAPFVAREVAPEVRNAALKKLFADPHYNLMDRLDIYIDDYSKPDPLPEAMLRQMASAKFLKLFEDQEEQAQGQPDQPERRLGDDADSPAADSVAQSAQPPQASATPLTENTPQAPGPDHDHTDLRLQPNHAAGPQEPGRSTE